MARTPSPTLTPAELRIMSVLWETGQATAAEVREVLTDLADSTIRTMLRILEGKGYVTHHADGRQFVYAPTVARDQARTHAIRDLLGRMFDGRPEALMLHLVRHEGMDPEELDRLRRLVADRPREE